MRGPYIVSPRFEAEEVSPRMAARNYEVLRWRGADPGGELDQEISFYGWSLDLRAYGCWIDENFRVIRPWWVHDYKDGKP